MKEGREGKGQPLPPLVWERFLLLLVGVLQERVCLAPAVGGRMGS
jgi:hypothetical protein